MRLKVIVCGLATVVPALLLAGCGVDSTSVITPNLQAAGFTGRMFGGQQPVVGSTIEVVAVGTSGYGSAGTVLQTATTDANGNFSMAPYTCPQSNTPVYLLGLGGDAGSGTNASAAEAAWLGVCVAAPHAYVVMNELTTTATAFVFSHFFGTTSVGTNIRSDAATNMDWIGGPSTIAGTTVTYSAGLTLASYTYPVIMDNAVGYPYQGTGGTTVEWQKIVTIADILGACVNSSGSTSSTETKTTCGKIFNFTKNGLTTRPSDTLQAAVQMALNPTVNVAKLYNVGTSTPPFSNYLTSAPNDWSIGVSYTTSGLGLAVDTGTVSTLDIDSSSRIWFPSDAAGKQGVAYFDPTKQTFSGPYNTTGLTHPEQVAIDANGYAWLNDSGTAKVSGYLVTSPTLTESVSLGTTSQGVTVGGDNRIDVGVTNGGKYELAYIPTARTGYTLASGITFAYPVTSLAGDSNDGTAVTATDADTTAMRNYYVTSVPAETSIKNANDDSGQVIWTGNDDVSVRSYAGNADDGLCIYSTADCYTFKGGYTNQAEGVAIDGAGQLWVAVSGYAGTSTAKTGNAGVMEVPVNNPGASDGSVYLNSTGANNIPDNLLLHDGSDGDPQVTVTAPYGIGVDVAGNVWMTNAGCAATDCTPTGNFTLTEIVGAAYPTITPVSAQITSGNLTGTEPAY